MKNIDYQKGSKNILNNKNYDRLCRQKVSCFFEASVICLGKYLIDGSRKILRWFAEKNIQRKVSEKKKGNREVF